MAKVATFGQIWSHCDSQGQKIDHKKKISSLKAQLLGEMPKQRSIEWTYIRGSQCDQMLEYKVAQFYPKPAERWLKQFFSLKVTFFIKAQKLVNFWAIFVQQSVTKIVQKQPNLVTLVAVEKERKRKKKGTNVRGNKN